MVSRLGLNAQSIPVTLEKIGDRLHVLERNCDAEFVPGHQCESDSDHGDSMSDTDLSRSRFMTFPNMVGRSKSSRGAKVSLMRSNRVPSACPRRAIPHRPSREAPRPPVRAASLDSSGGVRRPLDYDCRLALTISLRDGGRVTVIVERVGQVFQQVAAGIY